MYRISTNWCLNQIRNRKSRAQKRQDHKVEIVGDGVSRQTSTLDADKVRELIRECDAETQQIIVYVFFDDMTRQQVAELVGLSVPTVRKRLNAFLDRARRVMVVPTDAGTVFILIFLSSEMLEVSGQVGQSVMGGM